MDISFYLEFAKKIYSVFDELHKKNEWKKLFVELGGDIISLEHDEGELSSQIQTLFSKENLESMATSKVSDYDLIDQVKSKLVNHFSKNELYSDERYRYIEIFIETFKEKLKSDYHEIYDRIFLTNFREEVFENNAKLLKKIEELSKKFNELVEIGINIKTSDELNYWYMSNTINECTLELFNHENSDFVDKLFSKLSNNIIHIKGENINECVAYISYIFQNDIRFSKYKEIFRIVENENSWNQIMNSSIKNAILINSFNNFENLEILGQNKCIFIYGKNDYLNSKDYIVLEKRFFRNLIDKIKLCGFSYEESHELARKSRNNYTILMRNLFSGKLKNPSWSDKGYFKILLPAIISNHWLDKDSQNIEALLENKKSYKDYIKELSEINDIQDPFFVKHKAWNDNYEYFISDPEGAWYIFQDYVNIELFNILEPMIDLVLTDVHPKFDLPTEYHFSAGVFGLEPQCSDEFKLGFLETLIYLSRQESNISELIKVKIAEILKKVKNNKDWFSISEYLPLIIEINPDIVILKIEEEISIDNSGLINLFREKSDGLFTGTNYYINVLCLLEKALHMKNYTFRAIAILTKLMDLEVDYKLSNSPKNTLYNALVAWNHNYIYTIDEKVFFVNYIVENSKNGWLLLKELLPSFGCSTITSLTRPKYTSYLLSNELNNDLQIHDTYRKYYNIAFNNIHGDIKKLCFLFEDTIFFKYNLYERLKITTLELIKSCNDLEKYEIYKTIYKLISHNRGYQSAEWAESEENIIMIEMEILNSIIFNDITYRYQYIFESDDYILLNPISFEVGDPENSIERNQQLEEELRLNAINVLIKSKIDWKVFLSRFSNSNSSIVGYYLGKYLNDLSSIENLSIIFLELNLLSALDSFYKSLYIDLDVESVRMILNSDKLYHPIITKTILTKIVINEKNMFFINTLEIDLKQIFWENHHYVSSLNNEALEFAFENYYTYKNFNSLIRIAAFYNFSTSKLILVLDALKTHHFTIEQTLSYFIQKIFKRIYMDKYPNQEISQKMFELEVYFFNILNDKNEIKYIKYSFSKDPQLVADFISIAYKKEDSLKTDLLDYNEKEISKQFLSILNSIKFSPTNNGVGVIEYEELKNWCRKYIEKISDNRQFKVGMHYLGHILANTNLYISGDFPQDSVKRIIEDLYNDYISSGFIIEIRNSVGVRTISDGSDLYELSKKFERYSLSSQFYPKTHLILRTISESFLKDYELEKEIAKYEY